SQHPSGHNGADRVSRARQHPMRLTLVLQCVNRGSAENTKELERFYKEDVKSPCSRFNEFLVRAQRLVACRSPTPWQRPRPCGLQQLRQHDDHRREIGTRGRIDLWAAPCGATERAPCCERDGEDRTRPTKHEKAAGITRAAFLVSRPVASTTVVPT